MADSLKRRDPAHAGGFCSSKGSRRKKRTSKRIPTLKKEGCKKNPEETPIAADGKPKKEKSIKTLYTLGSAMGEGVNGRRAIKGRGTTTFAPQ